MTVTIETIEALVRHINQMQQAAQTQDALVEYLQSRILQLEAENAALQAAYTRRTQLALAAGLVRFVVTGDAP